MTVNDVICEVEKIEKLTGDPEAAHSLEDALYRQVLIAIKRGHPAPSRLAEAALRTMEIDFERWCA